MDPVIVALIAVISAVAVFLLLCLVLVGMIYKKMFGYRFSHDPLVTTYSKESLDLVSTPIEVELSGEKIRGALYTKKGIEVNKNILVIVCHGMWSSHLSYLQDVGRLCSAGYETLAFDYIGTSMSDGKTLKGFGQSLRCLDAVVKFVKNNPDFVGRRIYVYGHSWGGYAATNIVKFHPDIAGIVAIAPAMSFDAVARNIFPKGIHFLIPMAKFTDRIRMGKFANQNALKSLEGYKGRVLMIHSEDDPMCPYATTTGLAKEKFREENFGFIILKDKAHHPQYTYEGLAIMKAYNEKMTLLATEEEKNECKKATDFLAIGALDESIMKKIVSHIK